MLSEIQSFIHGSVTVLFATSLIGLFLGFVSSKIPLLSEYSILIKAISLIVLVVSCYFLGSINSDKEWQAKIKELQHKIEIAEERANQKTVRIETKVVEKIKEVKGNTDVVISTIPVYITKEVDSQCDISNSFVVLHDSAASAQVPPSPGVSYEGTSEVKLSEAATTVAENYGICNEIREQVIGWQEWYRTQKQIYESVGK